MKRNISILNRTLYTFCLFPVLSLSSTICRCNWADNCLRLFVSDAIACQKQSMKSQREERSALKTFARTKCQQHRCCCRPLTSIKDACISPSALVLLVVGGSRPRPRSTGRHGVGEVFLPEPLPDQLSDGPLSPALELLQPRRNISLEVPVRFARRLQTDN